MDTTDGLFLLYADADGISVQLGDLESIHKSHIRSIYITAEQRCQDRIGRKRSLKHHFLYLILCIMSGSAHFHRIYFIIGKKADCSTEEYDPYHTCHCYFRFFGQFF